MLGSGGAPALPAFAQSLLPQVAQPIANQVGVNLQPQADNDPPSHQVVDRDTDKDSSGLVQKTASKMLDVTRMALIVCACQVLPLARIKRIIKSEGDVKAVSSEASFAVARAAVSPAQSSLLCLRYTHNILLKQ